MDTSAADAAFAEWMRENLHHAADHFGLKVTGEPVYGWRLRSISAPVTATDGERWLRVVSQEPEWATGDHWTGARDANTINGTRKPVVLDVYEWSEGRHQRAEVMTRMPGQPCSLTDVLRAQVDLSPAWWADLRDAIENLAATPTKRINADQDKVTARIHERFGDTVDTTVTEWATAHGDLHWSNLFGPGFGLVDWEFWGTAPGGTDAATLHSYSLLIPTVAQQVHDLFADTLDTPTGRTAQLYVAARLLRRIDDGDYLDLAEPLNHHVNTFLGG
jgi:hypothetical protein